VSMGCKCCQLKIYRKFLCGRGGRNEIPIKASTVWLKRGTETLEEFVALISHTLFALPRKSSYQISPVLKANLWPKGKGIKKRLKSAE
jgi:hypothetical protein